MLRRNGLLLICMNVIRKNWLHVLDLLSRCHFLVFRATVCKTVRHMLPDRCLSVCPVCPISLSVTFVHCGQTVRRTKMKLGMQAGLGPGHTVLDGDPAPPR